MSNLQFFVLSSFVLFFLGLGFSFDTVFAEDYGVIINGGTSTPGCETTDTCYSPSSLSINVGQSVIFSNYDGAPHTVTSGTPASGSDGIFDSGVLSSGNSFSYIFDTPGVFDYYCMLHPWMIGQITVNGASANNDSDFNLGIITPPPNSVNPGDVFNFQIKWTNDGPAMAQSYSTIVELSSGLSFDTTYFPSRDYQGNTAIDNWGNMVPGVESTPGYRVYVNDDASGLQSIKITIDNVLLNDPNLNNNVLEFNEIIVNVPAPPSNFSVTAGTDKTTYCMNEEVVITGTHSYPRDPEYYSVEVIIYDFQGNTNDGTWDDDTDLHDGNQNFWKLRFGPGPSLHIVQPSLATQFTTSQAIWSPGNYSVELNVVDETNYPAIVESYSLGFVIVPCKLLVHFGIKTNMSLMMKQLQFLNYMMLI